MAVSYMTKDGYDKILAEINYLETVKRPEISAQIAEARDKGDLSENAEYDAAKEAQGIMEAKLAQLKGLISNARLIDESRVKTDEVQILNKVKIKNTKNNAVMTYTLVSDSEANLKEGKISVTFFIIFCIISNCLSSLLTSSTRVPLPAAMRRLRLGLMMEGFSRSSLVME